MGMESVLCSVSPRRHIRGSKSPITCPTSRVLSSEGTTQRLVFEQDTSGEARENTVPVQDVGHGRAVRLNALISQAGKRRCPTSKYFGHSTVPQPHNLFCTDTSCTGSQPRMEAVGAFGEPLHGILAAVVTEAPPTGCNGKSQDCPSLVV